MSQKQRYNRIWGCNSIQKPQIWSTWETVKHFRGKKKLEIGPGNYPRIPIEASFFLDISNRAIENLKKIGGKGIVGDATNLPFRDEFFHLVVAIEVLEHIKDDKKAFSEIARVLKPSGFFLFSVPLKKELYDEFDRIAGHERRYEIEDLRTLLFKNGFKILKYRHPTPYPQLFNYLLKLLFVKKLLLNNKKHEVFFNLPQPLVNLYSRSHAFVEKKWIPQWQKDTESLLEYFENLSKHEGRGVVLFCQKM